jgi:DNA-binding NarL/FixJ family response regulator
MTQPINNKNRAGMKTDKVLQVLLVDDHDVVRSGVRVMLQPAQDIVIAHEAATASEAMRLVRENRHDVALIDISLPGKNGLELIKFLRAERPSMAILVFSIYSEKIYAIRALRMGVSGYLTKNVPASTLISAIRKVASGGKYITPEIAEKIADTIGGQEVAPHDLLTNRELEVLRLIASGEATTDIAKTMNISPHTVSTYRSRILEKTGLRNDRELYRYAFENALFT